MIFGHLDANSLRNKFDILSEHIKGSRDIVTVSETKIDVSFPKGQFSLKVFIHHLDLIVIEMVEELCFRGIMISQPNCQAMIFLLQKDLLLRLTCIERNGLLTVLITPTKVTKENVLDALSTKSENIILLGDFNAYVDNEVLQTFCKFYSLHILIK